MNDCILYCAKKYNFINIYNNNNIKIVKSINKEKISKMFNYNVHDITKLVKLITIKK